MRGNNEQEIKKETRESGNGKAEVRKAFIRILATNL